MTKTGRSTAPRGVNAHGSFLFGFLERARAYAVEASHVRLLSWATYSKLQYSSWAPAPFSPSKNLDEST